MSHEITSTDQVILHQEPAWHGLGIVVEDAPTPVEAQERVMPWEVGKFGIYYKSDKGEEIEVEDHQAILRLDTKEYFGIVSKGYQPIQNREVAEFCEALSEEGGVKCESAGSIRGGKKIWFLLKGDPFNVKNDDEIFPYVLVSNGHDGNTTFRVTPTTIRTVCSNTLHMVLGYGVDYGDLKDSAISIKHTTNVMERVAEARKALAGYDRALRETQEVIQQMADKQVEDEKAMEKFFYDLYQSQFGKIPSNPTNGWEERARDKAMSAYSSFSKRYDDEKELTGGSWWGVFNAYSGIVQHDQKSRGRSDSDRLEKRVDSNLFGLNAQRTNDAFKRAFHLASAV